MPIADGDIARVRLGQPAQVRLDALPAEVFAGKVNYVAASAETTGNVRTYLVRIALDGPQGVRAGMSGEAALITQ